MQNSSILQNLNRVLPDKHVTSNLPDTVKCRSSFLSIFCSKGLFFGWLFVDVHIVEIILRFKACWACTGVFGTNFNRTKLFLHKIHVRMLNGKPL